MNSKKVARWKVSPRATDLVVGAVWHSICSVSPNNLCPAVEFKSVTRTMPDSHFVAGDAHNVTTVTLRAVSGMKLNGIFVPEE